MQKVWENENLICYEENKLQYLQFKKLLEYPELTHCYTLRSENKLDFPPIYKDETKYKESCKAICECLNKNNEERFKSKQTDGNIKQLHKLEPNQIVKPHQTHTDNVEIVDKIKELNEVDGMITNKPNITLLTTSADCTSLLLYDQVQKVIGAVHSGWKGTLQAIGKKAVEKMMQAYGSNPLDIICCICPCIRKCCFEVEEDVKNLFENKYHNLENINEMIKIGNMVQGKQKYYIDTTAINKQLLKSIGLKEENIIDSGICTMCHPEYFHSYRVEKENSGRNAAIISLLYYFHKGRTMKMIDFTNAIEEFNNYKGSEKKKTLIYNNKKYLVKFPDPVREKNKNISYINNAFSEYIGSNIFKMIGFKVQNTILGKYEYKGKEKIVCGCEDFTDDNHVLYEFENLALSTNPNKKIETEITDIMGVLEEGKTLINTKEIKKLFWRMFVIDSIIGNTDRHNGNWGFLLNKKTGEVEFSPIYDCGSCLNPMLEDEQIVKINETELKNLATNCYSCLKENGKKINYMSYIKQQKNEECNKAILETFNNINLQQIESFINEIECISQIRKDFYNNIIKQRYKIIEQTYNELKLS